MVAGGPIVGLVTYAGQALVRFWSWLTVNPTKLLTDTRQALVLRLRGCHSFEPLKLAGENPQPSSSRQTPFPPLRICSMARRMKESDSLMPRSKPSCPLVYSRSNLSSDVEMASSDSMISRLCMGLGFGSHGMACPWSLKYSAAARKSLDIQLRSVAEVEGRSTCVSMNCPWLDDAGDAGCG